MPPAARLTDMHTCPMVTGVVPHVGGPILPPCEPTVLIGMDVLGLLDVFIIDYRRHEIQLRAR